jgi:arylsulfatase A-like enzyme
MHDEISKNNYYEESMRVPFIIRWTEKIHPRYDDLLLSTPDIYPTLLDLMGLSKDIPEDIMGTDFAGLFLSGKGKRPDAQLFVKVPVGQPALGTRGVRNHRYTLAIAKKEDGSREVALFDNRNDPYQMNNIAVESPETVNDMKALLKEWLKKTEDSWGN